MDQENTQVEAQEKTVAEPQNGAQQPDLNVNDLAAIRSIIDVASSRGAFKAAEMEAVGKIYNKLSLFLDSVTGKKE